MGVPSSPSDLRDRIRVDRRGEGAGDGAGNFEDGWSPLIDARWAKMEPMRGGEQVVAERATGVATFDIWVRFDSETRTIAARDRLVDLNDTSVIFNVRWVEDWDRKKRWIRIQAEKGVADG